jgi:hypothetical protein
MNVMNPIVEISRSPITNLRRKVKLRKLEWSVIEQRVSIEVLISYYDDNDNIIIGEGVSEYIRTLDAVNSFLVDAATGLDPDENTIQVIGEYDLYMGLISSGAVDVPGMIESAIMVADLSPRKKLD